MAVTRRRAVRWTAAALLVLVPLLALAAVTVRYLEFRSAADGDSGTRGAVVVEKAGVSGGGDEVCTGVFTPDDGGPDIEVDIEVDGRCTEGERLDAFLVEPAALHPDWWGRPTAWTAGTGTGELLAPVVVVLVFLVLPVLLAAVILRRRRPR